MNESEITDIADLLILRSARKMFYTDGVYDTVCEPLYNSIINYLEAKELVRVIGYSAKGMRMRAVDS